MLSFGANSEHILNSGKQHITMPNKVVSVEMQATYISLDLCIQIMLLSGKTPGPKH